MSSTNVASFALVSLELTPLLLWLSLCAADLRETAESLVQAEMAKMGGVRAEHPRMPKGPEKDLFEVSPHGRDEQRCMCCELGV